MLTVEEKTKALRWLYGNGNPVIRLWAAQRLGAAADELGRARAEMLRHPAIQYWVDCLLAVAEKPVIHNSFDGCLENCMRKVLLFGVRERDDPRLAAFNRGALEKLRSHLEHPYLNPVEYTILASYLAAMGYADPAVVETVRERIDSAHAFTAAADYGYHTDPAGYPPIPAARRSHPLVHPRFYPDNRYLYPLIYDLFAWANLPAALDGPEYREKIADIVRYVMDDRYQRLPLGYGLILVPPNKYYGMGWSVHLPMWFDGEENRVPDAGCVWWADAMAPFPAAARSEWFGRVMRHLDGFRTEDGFWKFPAAYLAEAADKYFVGGGHMGLGENRKSKDALKIESTAWMLRILEKSELV